jgi:hypothetical protein
VSDEKKRRGIVDPWREVAPVRPSPAAKNRVDLEDIDLDADLAIPGQYTIRSKHVSFSVTSVKIDTPRDALVILAMCVAALWGVKVCREDLAQAGIGVRCGRVEWNPLLPETPASTLSVEDAVIWFRQVTLDQGMLNLGRILRRSEAAETCRRHGIVVMLAA